MNVVLKIYNILGAEVATLINEELQPGSYKIEFNGSNFASGIYFYKLEALAGNSSTGNFVDTKKMILLK